jgi:hypothetical protein
VLELGPRLGADGVLQPSHGNESLDDHVVLNRVLVAEELVKAVAEPERRALGIVTQHRVTFTLSELSHEGVAHDGSPREGIFKSQEADPPLGKNRLAAPPLTFALDPPKLEPCGRSVDGIISVVSSEAKEEQPT